MRPEPIDSLFASTYQKRFYLLLQYSIPPDPNATFPLFKDQEFATI
ncbi:MAG: hypothetical protein JXR76_19900 [Deltaproteobacteria bacterium]|nr:hypothetical protein [Deltaproteobacteria bacterium]